MNGGGGKVCTGAIDVHRDNGVATIGIGYLVGGLLLAVPGVIATMLLVMLSACMI